MAYDYKSVADCFKNYVTSNWNTTNVPTMPTIDVVNVQVSTGKFANFKTRSLIIDRGEILNIPLDIGKSSSVGGYAYTQWVTTIRITGSSSGDVENIFKEFERIVSAWTSGGGGAFYSPYDPYVFHYYESFNYRRPNERYVEVDLRLNTFVYQQSV